jgi:hypothetical protein
MKRPLRLASAEHGQLCGMIQALNERFPQVDANHGPNPHQGR